MAWGSSDQMTGVGQMTLGLVLTVPLAGAVYLGATGSWADLLVVLLFSMFPVPFLVFVIWGWALLFLTVRQGIREGWKGGGGFEETLGRAADSRPPDGDEDGDA